MSPRNLVPQPGFRHNEENPATNSDRVKATMVGADPTDFAYFFKAATCHQACLMLEDFERVLDRIVEDFKNRNPVVIAGDFNAWAVECPARSKKQEDEEERTYALGRVLSVEPHTAQRRREANLHQR